MSRRLRRAKIVTMLGPAADRDNNPEKIIAVGVNIVYMNFPCGLPEDRKMRVDKVREIVVRLGRHVAILGDPQGPKIHISTFKESEVPLNIEDKLLLDANLGKGGGDREKAGIDHKGPPADVVPGDILLLDDGCVQLGALEAQDMKVFAEVTVDGPLSNNKGINKLGGGLSAETPTEKDKVDIKTVVLVGIDYLAISFSHCGKDLNYARRLTRDMGCDVKIAAKVERAKAVCSQGAMDNIILASDVVMVARGDLSVEIGDPELVDIQKVLIRRTRQLSRAIITATQMMEPMITNPIPTCAEVVDVANAVLDGTDAAMLSTKIAIGQYPSETAVAIARVCLGAEKTPSIDISKHHLGVQLDNVEGATAMPVVYVVNHLKGATVIITMTEPGCITLMASRINSDLPTFTISCHERTLNLTALYCGVTSVRSDSANGGVAAAGKVVNLLRDKGYLMPGNLVTVTQGDVMSTVGSTNTTRILTVE